MVTAPKTEDLSRYLRTAEKAAIEAGQFLVSQMGKVTVEEKNPRDYVTEADIEAQRIIQSIIDDHFPDHSFVGEESVDDDKAIGESKNKSTNSPFEWIVDPLDGTTNFIHQLRSFSVSIALRHNGKMIAGCVHDPVLMETYTATLSGGAFLNGQPIRPSKRTTTDQAIVVCSLPGQLTRESSELERMINVLCDSNATLRRLGSAALNLCYIACGRVDSYWSTFAKIWDVAAGTLILEEAGGSIGHINGEALDWNDLQFVAASTESMQKEMIKFLSIKELSE